MVLSPLTIVLLALIGAAVGSFLNVVIFRYKGEETLFKGTGGRSRCMKCHKALAWYELIPIISFVIQLGRCRSCKARISWQYPIVEALCAFIFAAVPYVLIPIGGGVPYLLISIWVGTLLSLVLISFIDIRLWIIPNGLNMFVALLGVLNLALLLTHGGFGDVEQGALYKSLFGDSHVKVVGSFLGPSAEMIMLPDGPWLSAAGGLLFGGLFFGAIYYLSRGRAMGFGDVKLALAAGLLLGMPDIVLATMLAFITGAFWASIQILRKKRGLKDMLPFGPFIALGITLTFFFGYDILDVYFKFFSFIF
ncbi:MAG: prepilin peptidase [Candidatus Colwellbacteria bacterium]|nr:prepilin peptidase [Candidatus Colwellbacteria bacterium]